MTEQLTEMSDADLVGKVVELEREIVTARFAHSMGKLENTASLKVVRRAVARLQTEARRREIAAGSSKGSLLAGASAASGAGESANGASSSDGFLKGIVDKIGSKD
jgi:large subunit ribosomal protein L29